MFTLADLALDPDRCLVAMPDGTTQPLRSTRLTTGEPPMVQSINPPSSGFDFADFLGVLVHIEVLGVETGINTTFGVSDAVRVNWTALDGPTPGRAEPDSLIFPKVLQNQLRGCVGQSLVGRLTQGAARAGQSPPWVLNPATPDEIALGNAFEQSRQQGPASVPPAAPPPAQPPAAPAWPQGAAGAPPAWPAQPAATAPRV